MPRLAPQHQPRFAPPRVEVRGTAAQRGYDSAWRRFRAAYLAEHPVCCFMDDPRHSHECGRAATIVDHIKPLPEGPRLDRRNCRPVCRRAHEVLTQNLKTTGRNELPGAKEQG